MMTMGTRDAAEYLGKSPGTLANWRCWGTGPKWTKGKNGNRGRVHYTKANLDAWKKGFTCPTCGARRVHQPEESEAIW